jgi:hypothetical protein
VYKCTISNGQRTSAQGGGGECVQVHYQQQSGNEWPSQEGGGQGGEGECVQLHYHQQSRNEWPCQGGEAHCNVYTMYLDRAFHI